MALKLFKNILLTLCAFFACFYLNQINAYKYKDNWVETIDKYSNAWGQLSEPTSMWLERTKKISKKFASLMAFSGPVSALVAAGLNTAFQPESDEYKAISKLNVDVIKRFNKISLELQSIGNRLFHRMNMIDYKNNVVFPMVTLQQIVNLALEPFPDPDIKKELKTTCWGGNGPVPTLIRIRDKVRNSCDWPDINDEKLIKRALQLFWKMENMKNIKDMHGELLEKYNLLKKEFLQNLRSTYQLKQLEIKVEKVFHKKIYDINEYSIQIEDVLQDMVAPEACILETALRSEDFKTEALESMANRILADVMQLGKLGGICANVSNRGDPTKTKNYIDLVSSLAELTIDWMGRWIERRLDIHFPNTQFQLACNAIGNDTISTENYNNTAEKFFKELIIRGLPMRHYTVIITEITNDISEYYGPYCTRNTECFAANHTNIKIAVLRQTIRYETEAINAQNFKNEWQQRIRDIISIEKMTKSLQVIATTIRTEAEFISDKESHSFLFLRKRTFLSTFCVINFGIYAQEAGMETSYGLIDYYTNAFREDAQQFYLFVFL